MITLESLKARIPLFLVFISGKGKSSSNYSTSIINLTNFCIIVTINLLHRYTGLGFSLQVLTIKILANNGVHQTFEFVFLRGIIQLIISSLFIHFDADRATGNGPAVFGDTVFVQQMLFLRSFVGFGGIAFSFLGKNNQFFVIYDYSIPSV